MTHLGEGGGEYAACSAGDATLRQQFARARAQMNCGMCVKLENPPMLKRFAVLILSVGMAAAVHADTANDFGARRSPADPVLDLNKEPELCGKALAAMTAAHRGVDFALDGSSIILREFTAVDMQSIEAPADSRSGTLLERADLDLDGTGQPQTVVLRTKPFNWSGDWHYAQVFRSPAAFDAVKAQWMAWDDNAENQDPSPDEPALGGRYFYPSAMGADGKILYLGNEWSAPSLFRFGKFFFLTLTANAFQALSPMPYTIFRIRANGTAEPVCTISQNRMEGLHDRFGRLPDVEALLGAIQIIGDPGPDEGTMHAAIQRREEALLAEKIAAARPWALAGMAESSASARDYHRHGFRLERFLDFWSQQEPWTRREYQTLLALTPPAIDAYAAYLQREFGVPASQAGAKSTDVLLGLLARYILIPAQFEEYVDLDDWVDQSAAPIVRRDRKAFDALVDRLQGEGTKAAPAVSKLLPMAIEWPYAFDRLLALGADPNLGNAFGKTPLMVAAHFNRPDAVRKLLKAGAKVDAQTALDPGFGYDIKHRRRTALMYAGENASALVIKLLLDAGAKPGLADTRDVTFAGYLGWNPRFTPAERILVKNDLNAYATSSASFDCGKAFAVVDRVICGSEVLRVFDSEIAVAYERLKPKRGHSLVAEQRAWIRERNRLCGAPPDADCLAEVLRTRVRVLHKRIEERPR